MGEKEMAKKDRFLGKSKKLLIYRCWKMKKKGFK